MKKNILLYICIVVAITSKAQQIPVYAQSWLNPFLFNPGFTGSNGKLEANLIHRNQWKYIPGSPVTSVLSLDGKTSDEKMGLGLIILDDKAGLFAKRGIYTSYSYKIKIANDHFISPGLNFGMQDIMVNFSGSNVRDNNDPFLFNSNQRKSSFDANFGIAYNWKDLSTGIGIQQLFANKYRINNDTSSYYRASRKYNVFGSYFLTVSKEYKIHAKPNILLNFNPKTPFQFDVFTNFDYDNLLFAGLGYRFNQAVSFNLGVRWNNSLRVSYNYDWVIGNLSGYTGGSHEILLGYSFYTNQETKEKKEFYTETKIDTIQESNKKISSEMERLRNDLKAEQKENLAEQIHEDLVIFYAYDYKNADGSEASKGFYMVYGQYKSLPKAEEDMKELEKENIATKIISNPSRGYTIYTHVLDNKYKALDELKSIRWKRPVAFVLELK